MNLLKDKNMEVSDEIFNNYERKTFKFLSKLEFPTFDGSNPRNWVKKCPRYSSLCKKLESQRVDVASIHLMGRGHPFHMRILFLHNKVMKIYEKQLCVLYAPIVI